jgi:hypothetical protein
MNDAGGFVHGRRARESLTKHFKGKGSGVGAPTLQLLREQVELQVLHYLKALS